MSQKILVVDDDSGVRDTLRMILEYEGYEVTTAPDGKTAFVSCSPNCRAKVAQQRFLPRMRRIPHK